MANIRKRNARDGSPRYAVQVRLKGHPQQTATFRRLADAKRWIKQTEAAILEGRHFGTEAKRHTVTDLLERYEREVLPSLKSADSREDHLEWWSAELGKLTLADVTPALLVECRAKLGREVTRYKRVRSPSTVNRYLATLSRVFAIAAVEWQWCQDNPVTKVSKLKEPRGRVRYLSDDERTRLLEACKSAPSPILHTVVVLALSTGGRKMEIMGLRWRDVDLKRGLVIFVDTKNEERRSLPLRGPALERVRELGKVRRLDTDLLFPGQDPKRPADFSKSWRIALKAAGIEDFRFHDLRHSAASYLAMSGATTAEIAAVLGHKTLSMVKRYAHLSDQHVAGVLERMTDKLFDVD